ncbi:MAG: SUMF1/EgtB/PvdO family nonheme iron enzyme [Deltaproteobacteria bacterium]|nr:SUMF1/EgtB/PvdO family nonheme iron enzyme [Deltaproteobacteria bacterium]
MGAQATDPAAPGYDPAAAPDEAPVHEVSLPAFRMDLREVTAYDYRLCVEAGACSTSQVRTDGGYFNFGQAERANHPINGVTWEGAATYCAWAGGRLPTEAEWEYAARGSDGRRFPSGKSDPCQWAHLYGEPVGDEGGCAGDSTMTVYALDQQSAFGLLGMSGNVAEWVSDAYAPDAYARPPGAQPPEVGARALRVIRGGSWITMARAGFRAAARASAAPGDKADDIGFRCAYDTAGGKQPARGAPGGAPPLPHQPPPTEGR